MAAEQSGDGLVGEIEEALKDRLRDTFVFAFVLAAVEQNWRFLYVLVRSEERPDKAIDDALRAVPQHWVCWALLAATLFSLLFPLLRLILISYRARVDVLTENVALQIRRGKLYDLETLDSNAEFRAMTEETRGLRQFVVELYRRFVPSGNAPEIRAMAQPQHGFAYRHETANVVKLTGPVTGKELGRLTYVVQRIGGTNLVLCAHEGINFAAIHGEVTWLALASDGTTRVMSSDPMNDPNVAAYLIESPSGVFHMLRRNGLPGGNWTG